MHPLLQGILFGFMISMMPGAPLFTIVQTSIHRGLRSGIMLASGIFLSDVTIIYLAFLGVLQFFDQHNNYIYAGIIGGFILIGFGVYTFYHKVEEIDDNAIPTENRQSRPVPVMNVLKGYFLNIMNPFVWILWISAMVGVASGFSQNKNGLFLFFSGTLLTIFSSDILKVVIANKIKQRLRASLIARINHLVGLILIGIGIFLIVGVFLKF
jgi:threonine/homoserine/homoserine lactone efflux protein